jgi:hypothetical protein
VGVEQRRDAGKIVVEDGVPGGTELGDKAVNLHGVPDQHGVRQQTDQRRLPLFSIGS